MTLVDDLLQGRLYGHGLEFESVDPWPEADGIALVLPARYWTDRTEEITEAIARYRWVLGFRCGDEEDLFDITAVKHPAIRWWVQTPRVGKGYGAARFLPLGYSPHFRALPPEPPSKDADLFLSAQKTHARRVQCFNALADSRHADNVHATEGFTQGMPPADYAAAMTAARVAPAPAGAVSADSFRFWEALEAHTIPIADDFSPVDGHAGYWQRMHPDAPYPILQHYKDLQGYVEDALVDYPRNANRIAAWWMTQKRAMAGALREDLAELGAPLTDSRSPITVLVSTSPIPSNPSTKILEETIESVRAQLPNAEIILSFDGVRPEQAARRADYELYIQRALWLADHRWGNVLPLINDDHLHQAVCTKRALEQVRTPLLLFVEHDAPLYPDRHIPWADLAETILAGDVNLCRLHHEASVLEPHRHLMLDDSPQKVRGVPMMRTIQWSSRPHLASTAFYRNLLDRWFPNDEKNFIEEVMHSRLITAYQRDGDMGWLNWRTWMYTPDGNIQRSYHVDGRAGESNFV